MRKKLSPWAHRELTVTTVTVTTVVTAPGPMITAQSRLGEVTAQSRRGHSSVTARSQLNHGIFSMITAQSRLGHGSVTAGCNHFGHCELTVSSRWAHGEQSWWPIFSSWVIMFSRGASMALGQSDGCKMSACYGLTMCWQCADNVGLLWAKQFGEITLTILDDAIWFTKVIRGPLEFREAWKKTCLTLYHEHHGCS